MKLSNQVVSLGLAKRLKELGVKQDDSHFVWDCDSVEDGPQLSARENLYGIYDFCAAFTVAELGEMLPISLTEKSTHYYLECWKTELMWTAHYKSIGHILAQSAHPTEAEARGLMLAYLIENKLMMV